MKLGDAIERALSSIGVTEESVTLFFGINDCGCKKRKEALNRLGESVPLWINVLLRGVECSGVEDCSEKAKSAARKLPCLTTTTSK